MLVDFELKNRQYQGYIPEETDERIGGRTGNRVVSGRKHIKNDYML
jgi:hypothetical protein